MAIDKGAGSPSRNRRQFQMSSVGQGLEFGSGFIYDEDSGSVSLGLATEPALDFTDGLLTVSIADDSGLSKDSNGIAIDLRDTNPGLELVAAGIGVILNGTSLSLGGSGLSVTAPEGSLVVTAIQTSGYTAAAGELVLADPSSGGFTITLPTAAGIEGRSIRIKNTTSSTNTITIEGDGSETIDGGASALMSIGYQAITLVSDGAGWWVVQVI